MILAAGALAALAVATAAAAMLYNQASSLNTQLAAAKTQLAQLSKQLDDARKSLENCRSELAAALSRNHLLSANVTRLSQLLQSCRHNATRLAEKLHALEQRYAALLASHRALRENYTKLLERYQGLETELKALQENYTRLLNSYKTLQKQYTALRENHTRLLSLYHSLEKNYQSLLTRYNSLNNDYHEALNRLDELQGRLLAAEQENAELHQRLDSLNNTLARLNASIIEADEWLGIYPNESAEAEFLERLLNESLLIGKKFQDILGLTGDIKDLALRVTELVEVNLTTYAPDPAVRYVDPYTATVNISTQVWSTPLDTLLQAAGDCEDQALLAYGVIAAAAPPGTKVYLILIHSAGEGHAAVLVDAPAPGGARQYIVLDPAGNYVNGAKLMLETEMRANNTWWYVYISPQHIAASTKLWLIRNRFAKIVYRDAFTGKYSDNPREFTRTYTDPFKALHDWIVKYWGLPGVDRIVLATPTEYHAFTSITDAAHWLETQQG